MLFQRGCHEDLSPEVSATLRKSFVPGEDRACERVIVMAARCLLLLLLHASAWASAMALSAPPVVVLGPGSLDLRLLTAKLAARAGLQTSLFSPSGSVQDIWLEQMYGVEDGSTDISTSAEPLRPAMVADADAREAALAAAEGLALISDGVAMPESALSSVLAVASQLKRIVCLSKMGVTRATAGPLGLGKRANSNPPTSTAHCSPHHVTTGLAGHRWLSLALATMAKPSPDPSPSPSPSPSPNPHPKPHPNQARTRSISWRPRSDSRPPARR